MDYLLFWGFGLIAAAVLLMVIDIFVPTLGVLTLSAIVVAVVGVICLFNYNTTFGLIGSGLVVIGGPVLGFVGLQLMPHTPIGRKMVLGGEEEDQDRAPPAMDANAKLLGAEGEVVSDLRPVGIIKINGEKYDALSEGALIRAGSKVKVVSIVDGVMLRVRALS